MADQHNDNIPALTNQIGEDIPDIKENLEFHKDIFQAIGTGFSNTDATAFAPNKWTMSTVTGSVVLSTGTMFVDVSPSADAGVRLSASAKPIMYIVKRNGNYAVTISTATGNIDGSSNVVLSQDKECMGLVFDGTNYRKVFHFKAETDLPQNYLTGLTLSVEAADVQDINVSAGQCTDSANAYNITLSAELTKQLDVAWAAGDDAGGFPDSGTVSVGMMSAGAISVGAWFHVFAFKDTSTGSVDIGVDTHISASNLLNTSTVVSAFTGTLAYRRLGSIKPVGPAASIDAIVQNGDDFLVVDPAFVCSVALSTAATTLALPVPPGVKVDAHLNCVAVAGGGATGYIFSPDANEETAVIVDAGPLGNVGTHSGDQPASQLWIRTDTSQQIKASGSGAGLPNISLALIGWKDRRGRDG
jgi:hypothetical protein